MIEQKSVNLAITSPAIEHSRFTEVLSILDNFIADSSMEASRGLMLTGPQGAGKSEICNSLLSKYPPEQIVRPVAYTRVPENFKGRTVYQTILQALGLDNNTRRAESSLKKLLAYTIIAFKTDVLVLDDAHNLLRHTLACEIVRSLMDETGIKVILVGQEHSKDLLNLRWTLHRRFRILVELSAWNSSSEEDLCKVLAVLQRVVSQSGVQLDYKSLINNDFARKLACGTRGRFKGVAELILRAILHAISRGAETLENKDFEQAFVSLHSISNATQNNPFSESFVRGPMNADGTPSQVAS